MNKKYKNENMVTISALMYWGGASISYDTLPFSEGCKIYVGDGTFYYFDINKSPVYRWGPNHYELLIHSVWGPEYVRFMDSYRYNKDYIRKKITYLSKKPQTKRPLNLSIWKHLDKFTYSDSILEKAAFSTRINLDNTQEAAQILHLRNTYTKDGLMFRAYWRVLSKLKTKDKM